MDKRTISGLAAAVFLFVVSGLICWSGFSLRAIETSMPSWTSVTGTLLKADLVQDHVPKRNTPKQWKPDLRYRYEVQGTTHEGKLLLWGDDAGSDREAVEKDLIRVLGTSYGSPLPRPVTVYYDPKDPRLSVLEAANRSDSSYGAFVVAGICGFLGLIILASAWSRPRTS